MYREFQNSYFQSFLFQMMQYVEALKKDEYGWKKCIDNMITNNMRLVFRLSLVFSWLKTHAIILRLFPKPSECPLCSSAEEYFVMLQVIEDFVNNRYTTSDDTSTLAIRQLLSHCLHRAANEVRFFIWRIQKQSQSLFCRRSISLVP